MMHSDDERSLHRRAWEAIPWLVNGRITGGERGLLEAHLRGCRECREEFAFQQRLRDELARDAGPAADPQPALERLWQRIDAEGDMAGRAGRSRGAWVRWLAAAAVIEGIALAGLIGANLGTAAPPYRTLSAEAPAPASPAIRAVFVADLPLRDLQALLDRARLHIVAGPSEAGVYTLASPTGAPDDTALALLRADPRVRFAEPVAGPRARQ